MTNEVGTSDGPKGPGTLFLTGGLAVVLGFVAGAFFAHRALRPVREITATARSIIRTGVPPTADMAGATVGTGQTDRTWWSRCRWGRWCATPGATGWRAPW